MEAQRERQKGMQRDGREREFERLGGQRET